MTWFNRFIDSIDRNIHQYKNILKIINRKTNTISVFKSVLSALLISFLTLLIPVLILVNMFIYTKLKFILSIGLLLCALAWGFLYFKFYYTILKSYHKDLEDVNLNIPMMYESIIVSLIILTFGIVIFSTIF